MRRFGKKGRRGDKKPVKVFDPSPLVGDVDLSNRDIKIYLVKMPQQLASQFEDPSKGVVGRLRLAENTKTEATSTNESKPEALSQIFLDKVASSEDMDRTSKHYELHTFENQSTEPNIFVFSHDPNGETGDTRIEGTVSHQCQARPVMNKEFRLLNKHRSYAMNQNSSKMMVINESQRKTADLKALRPTALMETSKEREGRMRRKEDSLRHLDVPDGEWLEGTRAHVFKAFEIQPYYTGNELAKVLAETTARLRPIIQELCTYNSSAPFNGKYELKDEYKTVEQRKQKEERLAEYRESQAELIKKRKEERAEREKTEGPSSKKPRL